MQPQAYYRETDFTDRTGDDTDHSAINTELDAAALSINQTRDNLALIQKDDGALVNGIVTADALDDSAFDAVQASVNAATVEAQNSAESALTSEIAANNSKNLAIAAKNSAETARDASQLNADNAAASALAASNSADSASTNEAEALVSKNAAQSSQAAAAISAADAASKATESTNAAADSLASKNAAQSSQAAAAISATAALTAQVAAEAARDSALAAYDNFDDRYLGSKTSDPSVDNDGNALVAGSLYYNSVSKVMRLYTGSAWVAAYVSGTGYLSVSNNLSDLSSASTARSNLGLGSLATKSSVAIADLSATGTPSASKYLRGDNSWQEIDISAAVSAEATARASAISTEATARSNADALKANKDGTNATGTWPISITGNSANGGVTSVNGQTGAVTVSSPTQTSQLTNNSGFITSSSVANYFSSVTAIQNSSASASFSESGGFNLSYTSGILRFTRANGAFIDVTV